MFESAGLPTISYGIQAFASRMRPMRIPRLILTPELLGKTLGRPHDMVAQRRYLELGLELLETATQGDTVLEA